MKTIGFIGAYDKTDLIIYIARILTAMNKRVLVIDTTFLQKAKYIVPAISPAKTYITTYEDIDIAVGFYDYYSIKSYLGISEQANLDYDYIFIDIDSYECLESFNIQMADKNYFVTGLDVYTLRRGLEILSGLQERLDLTKVLFAKNLSYDEEEYFNFLSLGAKVNWSEETIYFPFEQGDAGVIIQNQMVQKIKFKKLTELYKGSLMYIASELLESQQEQNELRKVFKQLEKGV
ncbi:putative uncharacterized protein [Clostridium sp. CAG:567]|nr:putative uncharacterized protein [Clostridium sp. CAG:567]